jgi:glyoxylase-like metal-dependent hydrolase (beta-lactamase superfamily II)
MLIEMNRRSFLRTSFALGAAAAISPRMLFAQSNDHLAQAREGAAKTPIKVTKLYDNLFLLQGAGGNMAAQLGPDGILYIDSSFASAVPHIKEALAGLTHDAPDTLVNTHWHFDHTDGNEAMHTNGFHILAHTKTRQRLSASSAVKLFGMELPAYPAAALPTTTFDHAMHIWHNGDELNLVHVEPAHTDTDIYIHFHKADVLHTGDLWFNGFYPFIDEGSGGNIDGMIKAGKHILSLVSNSTKLIPGHGPLGDKAGFQKFNDMLSGVRDNVAKLKTAGLSEQEAIAKKPTASFDADWGKGMLSPDVFVGIVYRTL